MRQLSCHRGAGLAPLLSCMFEGASDAANYQIKLFLGNRFVQLQTSLSVASDDMDKTTHGNVQNIKAEANKMFQTHKAEMETLCTLLQESESAYEQSRDQAGVSPAPGVLNPKPNTQCPI